MSSLRWMSDFVCSLSFDSGLDLVVLLPITQSDSNDKQPRWWRHTGTHIYSNDNDDAASGFLHAVDLPPKLAVGSLIEMFWLKKPITGLNLLVYAWTAEGYGFIEFEISNCTISTDYYYYYYYYYYYSYYIRGIKLLCRLVSRTPSERQDKCRQVHTAPDNSSG